MNQLYTIFLSCTRVCCFLVVTATLSGVPHTSVPHTGVAQPTMLKGCIISHELNTVPHFKVYYRGTQTMSNDDGFFSIPLDVTSNSRAENSKVANSPSTGGFNPHSLLICKDFTPRFESVNTVQYLVRPANKPYKFFALEKATLTSLHNKITTLQNNSKPLEMRKRLIARQIKRRTQRYTLYQQTTNQTKSKTKSYKQQLRKLKKRNRVVTKQLKQIKTDISALKEKHLAFQDATPKKPAGDFWFIDEKKAPRVIPDNCVIVCLNPKTVAHIENWNFALSTKFLSFPRIILKKNLETRNVKRKQSITRSSLKSELYSFEKNVFHEVKKESYHLVAKRPNVKISLVQ